VPLALVAVVAGSYAVSRTAPPTVAQGSLVPYSLGLLLGPSLVYPWLRRRDASQGGALLGALLVPALWLLKECRRVAAVHGVAQSLYYVLNPLCVGVLAFAALQMAVAEIWLRRGTGRSMWGPLAVVGGFAAMALSSFLFARAYGAQSIFYAYVALHARIFGG
jgi:hypothetical protein